MDDIFWAALELVIFDVDGTLYDQRKLRKIVGIRILLYYLIRPWKYVDLLILYHFRKERENHAGYKGENLEIEQYIWCAEKSGADIEKVKRVVDRWIFKFPNQYLQRCLYPGVQDFFQVLKAKRIKTAVYSDYNAVQKLKSMALTVDLEVCSTDHQVNSFKPSPDGLLFVLSAMEIKNGKNCLFIGDRFELDGLCANYSGIPFLLVKKEDAVQDFYQKLSDLLVRLIH